MTCDADDVFVYDGRGEWTAITMMNRFVDLRDDHGDGGDDDGGDG